MLIKNSVGKVYYGMHFYPGVAEYREPGKDPYRIFINEDTIRGMAPSFAGRPIFVEHTDEVEQDLDELRKGVDGWVTESFFNEADGKHWVKFLIVSEKGERAIRSGWRLSNAYHPVLTPKAGLWNGVEYHQTVTGGTYEHLAIVQNPRYEESVIMDPEEFKLYNEGKKLELSRLANSKDKEENPGMSLKLNFFKRAKVENSVDLESMCVLLPKSGKEKTITQLVNEADEMAMNEGVPVAVSEDAEVSVGDAKMKLSELVSKFQALVSELEALKASNAGGEGEQADVDSMNNDEDEKAREKALELAKHEEKEIAKKKENEEEEEEEPKADDKKKNAKDRAHFDKLKNARDPGVEEVAKVDLSMDRVARGKARYGSN